SDAHLLVPSLDPPLALLGDVRPVRHEDVLRQTGRDGRGGVGGERRCRLGAALLVHPSQPRLGLPPRDLPLPPRLYPTAPPRPHPPPPPLRALLRRPVSAGAALTSPLLRVGRLAPADHPGLTLLQQVERLRHLRVDRQEIRLERAQLLERGVRLELRLLERL